MICCGVVCGVVCYGVVWCGVRCRVVGCAVGSGAVWYGVVSHGVVWHDVLYAVVWCGMGSCGVLQCRVVSCSVVWYAAGNSHVIGLSSICTSIYLLELFPLYAIRGALELWACLYHDPLTVACIEALALSVRWEGHGRDMPKVPMLLVKHTAGTTPADKSTYR
jgi:hypothetical protein